LVEQAKRQVDATGVYGKQVGLIDDFLKDLRMKLQQFGQKRGPVRKLRMVGDCRDIVIDRMLDDENLQTSLSRAIGRLGEFQAGRAPTFVTWLKDRSQRSSLCFAIRCDESVSPYYSMPGH
jgi:hypothetical protein